MKKSIEKLRILLNKDLENVTKYDSFIFDEGDIENLIKYKLLSGQDDNKELTVEMFKNSIFLMVKDCILDFIENTYDVNSSQVFSDFKTLENILEEYKFSYKEMFEVIMEFIERNINTGCTREKREIININKINEFKFKYLNIAEIKHKFLTMSSDEIIESLQDDPLSKQKVAEFIELYEFCKGSDNFILYKKMEEHYFNKIDTFTQRDIKICEFILKKLGISDKTVEIFISMLQKEIIKRENDKGKNEVIIEHRKKILNDEYYKIIEELIDIKFNIQKQYIYVNDYIKLAYAKIKLGENKDQILRFFRNIEDHNYSYDYDVDKYLNDLYLKVSYYSAKYGLQSYIDEYLETKRLYDSSIGQEKYDWLQEMLNILNTALSFAPKRTFEYELFEADKLVKAKCKVRN